MQSWTLTTELDGELWVTNLRHDRTQESVTLHRFKDHDAAHTYHQAVSTVLQQAT